MIMVVSKPAGDNGGHSTIAEKILENMMLVSEQKKGRKVTNYLGADHCYSGVGLLGQKKQHPLSPIYQG